MTPRKFMHQLMFPCHATFPENQSSKDDFRCRCSRGALAGHATYGAHSAPAQRGRKHKIGAARVQRTPQVEDVDPQKTNMESEKKGPLEKKHKNI